MARVSFAITVCNEHKELQTLLAELIPGVYGDSAISEYEIVVLVDKSKVTEEVYDVLDAYKEEPFFKYFEANFAGDFAQWKNYLNNLCKMDYICQLDADEVPSSKFLNYLGTILNSNSDVDLFMVPRKNTVEGLTDEDIRRWRWQVKQDGEDLLVNWPDYQFRIYRNKPEIKWQGKVHERPVGYQKYAALPDSMFLWHRKNIEKQRQQNALYINIANNGK